MTMKKVLFLALVLSLTACKTTDDPDNTRAVGAVAGAIVGAIIGYSIGNGSGEAVMALLGAAAGGAGGYYAADAIVKHDQKKMNKAAYEGLANTPVGGTVYWQNSDTGSAGSFKILRAFLSTDGRQCREFIANVMGERDTIEKQRTACRIHGGAWEII